MTPIERILDVLRGKGLRVADRPRRGGRWKCQCPAHQDDSESLDVMEGRDGQVVFKCFGPGCSAEQITRALGLAMKDLYPETEPGAKRGRRPTGTKTKKKGEAAVSDRVLPEVPLAVREYLRQPKPKGPDGVELKPVLDWRKPTKKETYTDEGGNPLILSERFETRVFRVVSVAGASAGSDASNLTGSLSVTDSPSQESDCDAGAGGLDPKSPSTGSVTVEPYRVGQEREVLLSDGSTKRYKTFKQSGFAPNGWKRRQLEAGWYELDGKVWVLQSADPEAPPSGSAQWFEQTRRVLFALPKLRAAAETGTATVWLNEGEKDVRTLWKLGLVATCNPMGANKWEPGYSIQLEGFSSAVIWCDRDLAGYRHALLVKKNIVHMISDVRIVEGVAGNDATDHVEAGFGIEDVVTLSEEDVLARIEFILSLPAPLPLTNKAESSEASPSDASLNGLSGPSGGQNGASGGGDDPGGENFDSSRARGAGGGWTLPWFAPWTDAGNAERVLAKLDHTVKWCEEREQWLNWDGTRWKFDRTGGAPIRRAVVALAREIRGDSEPDGDEDKAHVRWCQHAKGMESASSINNTLSLLKSLHGVPVVTDELDMDLTTLACANGHIDLRTGELMPGDREKLLTRRINIDFDPEAKAPLWSEFMRRVVPDDEDRRFLHRWFGYCLTGLTVEQKLLFVYGPPATGKSTLVQTLTRMMSEYYETIDRRKLMNTRMAESEIPAWLAQLKGARLVTAVECKDSDRLDASIVKIMTGNEDITARYLHQNPIQYRPQFKLIMTGNYRFQFDGDDSAIARRILEVTLDQTVKSEDRDPYLDVKLWEEREGIFAWAVAGAQLYFKSGLSVPGNMAEKIKEYQKDMDFIGQFIDEKLDFIEGRKMTAGDMFKCYSEWAKDNNEWKMSAKALGSKLRGRIPVKRETTTNMYLGVARRPESVEM